MKSIIITGVTSGIGYECAIQIAKLAALSRQIISLTQEFQQQWLQNQYR